MYHRIIILALLFLCSEKTNYQVFHISPMEISNALPVQFWLTGCATFNEHHAAGVFHKCFCAPWECDDEIKIQLKTDADLNLSLVVFDEDEVELNEIEFEETSDGVYSTSFIPGDNTPDICDKRVYLKIRENAVEGDVAVTMPALTDFQTTTGTPPTLAGLASWINASSGPNPGTWSLSATPDVSVNGFFGGGGGGSGLSGYICGAIATNDGFDYEFDVQFEFLASGGVNPKDVDVIFAILDSSFNELDTVTFNYTTFGVKTPNFTLNPSGNGTYLGMRIVNDTPFDTHSFELQSASYTPGPVSYEWTLGANPTVTLPGNGPTPPNSKESEITFANATFIVGVEYTVTMTYTRTVNSGASNPRTSRLMILNSSNVIQFLEVDTASVGSNSLSITFTATASTTRIGFSHQSGSNVDITLTELEGTRLLTVGTTQILAKSDCLDIRQNHEQTILLTYSNHRNFAGLVYQNTSPTLEFNIRIPAIFFHQRFPEEDEVMELSSELATLNGTLRKQRLLDTDYVPYYFHEKLKLILKHQSLSVFNREWVKQEAYQITEGNRLAPLKKAQCWLSEKEFVHRNIL